LRIDAPFGLDDVFAMRLRPNPIRKTTGFEATRIGGQRMAGATTTRFPFELTTIRRSSTQREGAARQLSAVAGR